MINSFLFGLNFENLFSEHDKMTPTIEAKFMAEITSFNERQIIKVKEFAKNLSESKNFQNILALSEPEALKILYKNTETKIIEEVKIFFNNETIRENIKTIARMDYMTLMFKCISNLELIPYLMLLTESGMIDSVRNRLESMCIEKIKNLFSTTLDSQLKIMQG